MTQETTTQNDATTTTDTAPVQGGTTSVDAKFTQADLDRIMGETRLKATEAARKKLLAELEIDDPIADKELLAAARKRKADEQTAAEKALDDLGKEKAKREKAETDLKTFQEKVEAEMRATRLTSAVKDALTAANAKADKVLALLQVQHADALAAVIKDDGVVDAKAVTALVETARKAWPEDFGTRGVGTGSHSQGRAVEPGKEGKELALKDLRERQRNGW